MDAVRHVKDLIQMPQGHRRFYIACEGLGREPLLKALAEKWKQPIFVPRNINEGIGFHV